MAEVKQIRRLMARGLGQLGFDYIFSQDGEKVRKFVRFDRCEIRPDEYLLRVDSRRLPRGVNLVNMTDINVLRSLEATIGKPMQYHLSEMGLWFRIFRESGVRNIPGRIDFIDMLNALPADASPLEIAMGLGENRRVVKFNFQQDNTAHMLIAGATGTGKTNTIHVIINTLIRRNPAEVKLLLIDLKRCEFPIYNGLPHLIRPVVTEIDQVLDSVRMMYEEMNRRLTLFESGKGHTSNIREYNRIQKRGNRLSYWVCIFDEFAILTDKKTKAAKEVIELFCDIGRLGRAAGIHCVLATQRPDRDVILPQLKTNFPGKIALACADVANSKVIIDSGDACFKDRDIPPGRAIMARGRYRDQFQTAFISKDMIASFIGNAEAGRFYTTRPAHDVTVQELARYALDNCNGCFDQARLGAMFKVRGITYHEIRELSQRHRGETFIMDGVDYILCQRDRRKPVMVETLTEHNLHSGQKTDDTGDAPPASGITDTVATPARTDTTDKARQARTDNARRLRSKFVSYLLEHPAASPADAAENIGRSDSWGRQLASQLKKSKWLDYDNGGWVWTGPALGEETNETD